MANNRMYLLHRPSGRAVYLGKRMASGWYGAPSNVRDALEALYEAVERDPGDNGDDFCIAMEDVDGVMGPWPPPTMAVDSDAIKERITGEPPTQEHGQP